MSELAELDPNFVINAPAERRALEKLMERLDKLGVASRVRPGTSSNSVYVFVRDSSGQLVPELKGMAVEEIIPLYGGEQRKRLEHLAKEMMYRRLFPSTGDLTELATLTRNPEMALYFAFQKTYTLWLLPLAAVGAAFRFFAKATPWEFNMFYAIALLVWGMAFATFWNHSTERWYSEKLGFKNIVPLSEPKSVVMKKLCFTPIAITFMVCMVCFQFVCFMLEIYITQIYNGPLGFLLALIPTVLLSAYVPVLTAVYNVFVNKLVKWENAANPERSRVEKNYALSFLTSYVPLLITLFVYLPMGHMLNPQMNLIAKYSQRYGIPVIGRHFMINTERYRTQFFYFTVTNQLVAMAVDNILPIVMGVILPRIKGHTKSDSELNRARALTAEQYPKDIELVEHVRTCMLGPWGPFKLHDNVSKLVIQFGYVVMFSTIWPLAPLICVIFNIVISKFDIWRALKKHTPSSNPNTYKSKNLGLALTSLSPWNPILEFTVWVASVVSPALIIMYRHSNLPGFARPLEKHSTWFIHSPIRYDWKLIFIYVAVAEHLGLLLHFVLSKIAGAPASNDSDVSPSLLKRELATANKHFDNSAAIPEAEDITQRIKSNYTTKREISQEYATRASGVDDTRTSVRNFEEEQAPRIVTTTEHNISHRKQAMPAAIAQVAPKTAAPVHERSTFDRKPSCSSLGSSGSLYSSVAGATLPHKIPTSKNYDERQGYPTPTQSNSMTSTKISIGNGDHSHSAHSRNGGAIPGSAYTQQPTIVTNGSGEHYEGNGISTRVPQTVIVSETQNGNGNGGSRHYPAQEIVIDRIIVAAPEDLEASNVVVAPPNDTQFVNDKALELPVLKAPPPPEEDDYIIAPHLKTPPGDMRSASLPSSKQSVVQRRKSSSRKTLSILMRATTGKDGSSSEHKHKHKVKNTLNLLKKRFD
ncbi:ADL300Wp [Eremothecium gossypii ATCC 10895]|uniref:ADL300Wp n=1 Tax=Eremothecium gossypii (strain ATCC 10895 / CBS 109.51 / FGSC 9923 / NRRL Y-1056) TaxID=284811 RepID=Q75B72_EREGS|nr:ADL300Wp [Eremothecium gossypii ATCC 10895]AAS51620.1 ADL300Wp [Eremothecium gossypii ATCC 10895]